MTTEPTTASRHELGPTSVPLGLAARKRPRPGLAHALGAGAGVFLVVAVMNLADQTGDGSGPLIVGALVLVLGALLAIALRTPGPSISTTATVLAIATPVLIGLAVAGEDGPSSLGDVKLVLGLVAAAYLALAALGARRSHGLFLGLGVATALVLAAVLVGGSDIEQSLPAAVLGGDIDGSDTWLAVTVVGAIYLALGWIADRAGRTATGTPLVLVGGIGTVVGAAALGDTESDLLAALLAVGAGLAVAFVGSATTRRFTTWFGATVVTLGLAGVVSELADDDDWLETALSALAAVAMLSLAFVVWLTQRRPDDGDADVLVPVPGAVPPPAWGEPTTMPLVSEPPRATPPAPPTPGATDVTSAVEEPPATSWSAPAGDPDDPPS